MPQYIKDLTQVVKSSHNLRKLISIDSVWNSNPSAAIPLGKIIDYVYPYLRRFAKNLGLVTNLPIQFGGSGLPTGLPMTKS